MSEEFVEFASARAGSLFRTAYLLTGGDRHLAEDLVQTTLGKLFAAWKRVSRAENPAAYAQTVLTRTFISHRRRRSSSEIPIEHLPDAGANRVDSELRLTLLDALRQLPERDRAIVVLRYWEDRSIEETAAQLGIRIGIVRTQSMRSLAKLRALLGDDIREMSKQ